MSRIDDLAVDRRQELQAASLDHGSRPAHPVIDVARQIDQIVHGMNQEDNDRPGRELPERPQAKEELVETAEAIEVPAHERAKRGRRPLADLLRRRVAGFYALNCLTLGHTPR
jgi:hypothetical protein